MQPIIIEDNIPITPLWTRALLIGLPRLNEQEGSLRPLPLVSTLWPTSLANYSWQTLLHDCMECHHPGSMWAHNPQFHRTGTWLSCTFIFPRLFLLLDLIWASRFPYLVMFSPISDSVLMPDAMDPSFIIHLRHQMHAYSLEISHTFFCLSRGIPWV